MASQYAPLTRMSDQFSSRLSSVMSMLNLYNNAQALDAGVLDGPALNEHEKIAHRGTQAARMRKIAAWLREVAEISEVIAGIHAGDDAHPEQ